MFVTLVVALSGVAALLLLGNAGDQRAHWLGGALLLAASPLLHPLFVSRAAGGPWLDWIVWSRPDAFLPAFLWRFAAVFPVPLDGRARRLTRIMAGLSVVAGAVLFVGSALSGVVPAGTAGAAWIELVRPRPALSTGYWQRVSALGASAFPFLLWRGWRAEGADRTRLSRPARSYWDRIYRASIRHRLEHGGDWAKEKKGVLATAGKLGRVAAALGDDPKEVELWAAKGATQAVKQCPSCQKASPTRGLWCESA